MTPTCGDKTGTLTGWNRHSRAADPACSPCRAAKATYMRQYRATGAGREQARFESRVRSYALARLIARHRSEFNDLLNDVRDREKKREEEGGDPVTDHANTSSYGSGQGPCPHGGRYAYAWSSCSCGWMQRIYYSNSCPECVGDSPSVPGEWAEGVAASRRFHATHKRHAQKRDKEQGELL